MLSFKPVTLMLWVTKFRNSLNNTKTIRVYMECHSVETPCIGGSKKTFGTFCLASVGCGSPALWANGFLHWAQFGFALFPRLPVSERGSKYQQQFLFINFSKYHLNGTTKIYKEFHAGLKWMEFVRQKLIKLEISSICGVLFSVILWSSVQSD